MHEGSARYCCSNTVQNYTKNQRCMVRGNLITRPAPLYNIYSLRPERSDGENGAIIPLIVVAFVHPFFLFPFSICFSKSKRFYVSIDKRDEIEKSKRLLHPPLFVSATSNLIFIPFTAPLYRDDGLWLIRDRSRRVIRRSTIGDLQITYSSSNSDDVPQYQPFILPSTLSFTCLPLGYSFRRHTALRFSVPFLPPSSFS